MKKVICAALALLLMLGAAALAEAGAADAVSGRIDFTVDIAPYAGKWVSFDDGFRLYLPAEWTRASLTEAQAQAGLFYNEGNGGADSLVGEVPMAVAVGYTEAGQLSTLDELAADFAAAGFTEVDKLDLNGILAATFVNREADYRGVAFFHPLVPGYVMTVYLSPCGAGNQTVNDVGSAILCSLTPRGAWE